MALPIVICGRTTAIGSGIRAGLEPEYELIHFILSEQDGAAQLPYVLRGKSPPPELHNSEADSIATNNYAHSPKAVILGKGYESEQLDMMMDACGELAKGALWLRPDMTAPGPTTTDPQAYREHMVQRVRDGLAKALKEEKKESTIFWY